MRNLFEELARCDREIEEHAGNLRAGHTEVAGLLLALADWRGERRLILQELYG